MKGTWKKNMVQILKILLAITVCAYIIKWIQLYNDPTFGPTNHSTIERIKFASIGAFAFYIWVGLIAFAKVTDSMR